MASRTSRKKKRDAFAWRMDLRKLPVGYFVGGRHGHLVRCSVCGAAAVRLKNTWFSHVLEFRLTAKQEPIVYYKARHAAR